MSGDVKPEYKVETFWPFKFLSIAQNENMSWSFVSDVIVYYSVTIGFSYYFLVVLPFEEFDVYEMVRRPLSLMLFMCMWHLPYRVYWNMRARKLQRIEDRADNS